MEEAIAEVRITLVKRESSYVAHAWVGPDEQHLQRDQFGDDSEAEALQKALDWTKSMIVGPR